MGGVWIVAMLTCALLGTLHAKSLDTESLNRLLQMLEDKEPISTDKVSARTLPHFAKSSKDYVARGDKNSGNNKKSDFSKLLTGSPKETRGSNENYQLHMCFFCDARCMSDIATMSAGVYVGDTHKFFDEIAAKIQERLSTLDGADFSVTSHIELYPYSVVEAMWYSAGTGGDDLALIADVAANFWETGNLFQTGMAYGCNVGYHVVSASDSLWAPSNAGSIDGVANMMKICSAMSYGTVKLMTNMESMVTLLTHETGHLLGIYHDGAVHSSYMGSADYFRGDQAFSDPFLHLEEQCRAANHHCADGQDKCIMREVGGGASRFSGCSSAYFNMFLVLSEHYPAFYTASCMELANKRSLSARAGDDTIPTGPILPQ